MTEHYFTANPQSKHDLQEISFTYQGKELFFFTDAGVFSKNRVDYGSQLLIKTVHPPLGAQILDLGCGYGPIGICLAANDPSASVTMVDINQRALALAQRNAQVNHLANIKVYESDGFQQVEGVFDTIVMNPPIRAGKQVIYTFFEESIYYLKSGGSLYIVIQKKQGGNSALKKLQEIFGNVEKVAKSGGFWVLQSIKN